MPLRLVLGILLALISVATPAYAQPARLANISTRGQVGPDASNLFGGFVISGGPKTVLVRAIGPGLAAFGVPGTLADPTLSLFDFANVAVATNDNWAAADAATFGQVGAFPLPAGSRDAVLVTTLQPGAYTAQISGLGSANTGVALLEIYDVGGAGQLVNIATRLPVSTGANAAVAGFVVAPGNGLRKLLVRGVGPALAAFGLPGTLPDPKLTVLDVNGTELAVAAANGAATALGPAAAQAGAFATGATDTAVIVPVAAGGFQRKASSVVTRVASNPRSAPVTPSRFVLARTAIRPSGSVPAVNDRGVRTPTNRLPSSRTAAFAPAAAPADSGRHRLGASTSGTRVGRPLGHSRRTRQPGPTPRQRAPGAIPPTSHAASPARPSRDGGAFHPSFRTPPGSTCG